MTSHLMTPANLEHLAMGCAVADGLQWTCSARRLDAVAEAVAA